MGLTFIFGICIRDKGGNYPVLYGILPALPDPFIRFFAILQFPTFRWLGGEDVYSYFVHNLPSSYAWANCLHIVLLVVCMVVLSVFPPPFLWPT